MGWDIDFDLANTLCGDGYVHMLYGSQYQGFSHQQGEPGF